MRNNISTQKLISLNDEQLHSDEIYRKWPRLQVEPVKKMLDFHRIVPTMFMDMGARTGVFIELMQKEYPNCVFVGVEIVPRFVEAMQKKGINTCQARAEYVPFQNESFDVIYSRHLIEHVLMPEGVIREQCRLLSPGGIAINQVPIGRNKCKKHLSMKTKEEYYNLLQTARTDAAVLWKCDIETTNCSSFGFVPQGNEKILHIKKDK